MGLGGAFIAVADDATAVSFNPAGLAQLLDPEVSFVLRRNDRTVRYQDFETSGQGRVLAASDSLTSGTRVDPLFLSATAPLSVGGRNLVMQLSVQRAFALDEDSRRVLDENPVASAVGAPAHLDQTLRQSGQIDTYAFAMAYELSQRILFGASYNRWRGRWEVDSTSIRTEGGADTVVTFGERSALDGGNFNFGLIWRWPTWSLGIVRRSGFHADFTFSNHLATNLPQGGFATPTLTTGLHWPASTGVGYAYRPSERWLLTADLTHTLWSTARYMSPGSRLDGRSFFDFDRRDRTPNATDFHAGAEYLQITEAGYVIPLRFGWSREPQPLVDRITGVQRVMYRASLGTGLKRGPLGVDVAYRYGWGTRRASQFLEVDQILNRSAATSTSVGTERITEHRIDFSANCRFSRGPLERAFHHLFVGD